jgi:hypothetical protein
MESKDLAAPGVQGQPQPLLIGLLADKAAELVRFNLQGRDPEWTAALRGVYVKVGGRRFVALLGQKRHQPRHAHAYGTANPRTTNFIWKAHKIAVVRKPIHAPESANWGWVAGLSICVIGC